MKIQSGNYSGRTAFLVMLMLSGLLLFTPQAQAQENPADGFDPSDSVHQNTILNLESGEVLLNRGHWTSRVVENYNCILFRGDGSDTWNISKCFERGTFEKQATGVALITREAGTLILNGELGPESGEGRYSFTPDRRYNRYLRRHFDSEEVSFSLPLFLGDMKTDFMDFLEDHYGEITADQVKELALHDVTQADFEAYLSLYRQYADHDPSLEEIVETKNNGIDQDYVGQLQEAGYFDLSLEQMMNAKDHGVNQEVIEGLAAAGFKQVPLDLLMRALDAGLSVETAQTLQRISQDDLTLEAIIELHKREIDNDYITQLEAAGLRGLNLDQVTRAKALNLDGTLRKSLQEAGVEADYRELLVARAAGVDTALVNQYHSSGLEGAGLEDLVAARQYNLDFSQLETWKNLGTGQVNLQELLVAGKLGITTQDLETFQDAGVAVYSLSELISAKIHGVDMNFIQRTQQGPIADSITTGLEITTDSLLVNQDTLVVNQTAVDTIQQAEPLSPDLETEESEPVVFEPLHHYISIKLQQDARLAQEAVELRQANQGEEQEDNEDQEARDRGFYQLDALVNPQN